MAEAHDRLLVEDVLHDPGLHLVERRDVRGLVAGLPKDGEHHRVEKLVDAVRRVGAVLTAVGIQL